MFIFNLAEGPISFDPIILLMIAMVIEGIIYSNIKISKYFPSFLFIISILVKFLEKKLNRTHRSQMDRAIRGVLVTCIIVIFCLVLSSIVLKVAANIPYGWALELILIANLLNQFHTFLDVRILVKHASTGKVNEARLYINSITDMDLIRLDEHTVYRIAIEIIAKNFVTGVVAPVFWFIFFGFPGLLILCSINTTANLLNKSIDNSFAFGLTACRLNDALMFLPARLASLFLILAAFFTPTANPRQAIKAIGLNIKKHRLFNLVWPISTMAGALSISLGGPKSSRVEQYDDSWIGTGKVFLESHDVKRSLYIFWVAGLINLAGIAGFAILRYGTP